MEDDEFKFESILKEIKNNLTRYESIIKEIENYPSKKKLSEAENTKNKIAQKIQMVKSIIKSEEDSFLLDSYIELNSELNKRLNIAIKRQSKNKDKNNFNNLFNNHDNEKGLGNMENINILDDEQQSLKNTIRMSMEINDSLKNSNEELTNQGKKLDESTEKVIKTLQKMPVIGKMLGDIKYYKIREKLIIGFVVGIVCFIMLYITFYRKR